MIPYIMIKQQSEKHRIILSLYQHNRKERDK